MDPRRARPAIALVARAHRAGAPTTATRGGVDCSGALGVASPAPRRRRPGHARRERHRPSPGHDRGGRHGQLRRDRHRPPPEPGGREGTPGEPRERAALSARSLSDGRVGRLERTMRSVRLRLARVDHLPRRRFQVPGPRSDPSSPPWRAAGDQLVANPGGGPDRGRLRPRLLDASERRSRDSRGGRREPSAGGRWGALGQGSRNGPLQPRAAADPL
jgi:hypothetical protein